MLSLIILRWMMFYTFVTIKKTKLRTHKPIINMIRLLTIVVIFSLSINEGFSQLQDTSNYIFLYMNGLASNQNLAKDAYIIDSDGTILHQWNNSNITSPETAPGYLTPDGYFLRGIESPFAPNGGFTVGRWGTVQLVDWNGNVLWQYDGCIDSTECLHHDLELMPNGNILVTAFHRYDEQAAAQLFGWNVTGQGKLLMDVIYEIQPDLINGSSQIVWEWKWIDHVIQDGNASLPNFGVIANNPGKIDLHFYDSGSPFLPILLGTHSHINSIDYNPLRDEILISSGTHDEIYVIDHSTTTAQAATSSGGNSGKGGDILYRWGNPQVYDYGGGSSSTYSSWRWTKTQHDARWLLDGSGNITIHNNNSTTDPSPSGLNAWSQFMEIAVPYSGNGYSYTPGQPFGPDTSIIWAEYDPLNPLFNCVFSGGGQKLDNGHIFTTSASQFTLLEHDQNGVIDWSFDLTTLHAPGGQVFKAQKYPMDYTGFVNLTTSVNEVAQNIDPFIVTYNPALNSIVVNHDLDGSSAISYTLIDITGKVLTASNANHYSKGESIVLDAKHYQSGIYILNIVYDNNVVSKKVIVTN